MNTLSTSVKDPWELTLQEYAETIYSDPEQKYLSMENIVAELEHYKQSLQDLHAMKITPRSVVGKGYVDSRKVAINWLNARILEYQKYVDKTAIHTVIRANHMCSVRQAVREGKL